MFHQHKYICSVKLRVVHNTCMFNKEALKNTMSISVVIRTSSNLASLDNMDIMSSDMRALKLQVWHPVSIPVELLTITKLVCCHYHQTGNYH